MNKGMRLQVGSSQPEPPSPMVQRHQLLEQIQEQIAELLVEKEGVLRRFYSMAPPPRESSPERLPQAFTHAAGDLYFPTAYQRRQVNLETAKAKFKKVAQDIATSVADWLLSLLQNPESALNLSGEQPSPDASSAKSRRFQSSPVVRRVAVLESEKMKEVKAKYDRQERIMGDMRLNFYRELQHLRDLLVHWKKKEEVLDYLHVHYFSESDGLDEGICEIFNGRVKKLKEQYEQELHKIMKANKQLQLKINFYREMDPRCYSLADYTLDELFYAIYLQEPDAFGIWKILVRKTPIGFFDPVIEKEYSQYLHNNSKEQMLAEIERMKRETQLQLQELIASSEKETKYLRSKLRLKDEQLAIQKEHHVDELERMRKEIHADITKKYEEREFQKFRKFDEEKVELYERVRRAEEQGRSVREQKTHLSLDFAFKKWTFAARVTKSAGADVVDRLRDILTGKEHERLQIHVNQLKAENAELQDEFHEVFAQNTANLFQLREQLQKNEVLGGQFLRVQDELQLASGKVQAAQDAQRKAQHEKEELERNNARAKSMIESLEATKIELEEVVARSKASAPQDFEIVRNKDVIVKKVIHQLSQEKRERVGKLYEDGAVSRFAQTDLRGLDLDLSGKRKDIAAVDAVQASQPRILTRNRSAQTMDDVTFLSLHDVGVGDNVLETLIADHILIQQEGHVHMSKLEVLPAGGVKQARDLIMNSREHLHIATQNKSLISDVVSQASYLTDRLAASRLPSRHVNDSPHIMRNSRTREVVKRNLPLGSSRLSPDSIDQNELTHETGADEAIDSQASRGRLVSKQDQIERMAREKYLSDVKMPTGGRINESKFRDAVRHLRSQRKGR